ncbi:MAG: hypothetical protein ACYSWZ_01870 [Planctomycetota bacterium]|jgi:hypothetical protein
MPESPGTNARMHLRKYVQRLITSQEKLAKALVQESMLEILTYIMKNSISGHIYNNPEAP